MTLRTKLRWKGNGGSFLFVTRRHLGPSGLPLGHQGCKISEFTVTVINPIPRRLADCAETYCRAMERLRRNARRKEGVCEEAEEFVARATSLIPSRLFVKLMNMRTWLAGVVLAGPYRIPSVVCELPFNKQSKNPS